MKIAVTIAGVVGCLMASLLITWLTWETLVNGRAFRCTDAGPFTLSLGFWTSAETHQSAGDQIQPGWTWEKVAEVNGFYKLAFFALWIGGSMVASHIIHRTTRAESYEHIAHPG
ncbi:MAG TPA: hypothetical protein VFE51_25765 [Verrucomicrobiae bacterium]|nr:hypothetical protein [Verrucomicrobiae bacterium]